MKKKRPVYLNLFQIKLPVSGVVSLIHRFSGALLFLSLPFFLWLFQALLESASSFDNLINTVKYNPILKLVIAIGAWVFLHHFLAGIRFLLLDMHWGEELHQSRFSAKIVMLASITLSALILGWLW